MSSLIAAPPLAILETFNSVHEPLGDLILTLMIMHMIIPSDLLTELNPTNQTRDLEQCFAKIRVVKEMYPKHGWSDYTESNRASSAS
ncbi:hypothetical protein VNO77_27579 [Canavalia gladiata]|uniref:Uncharacterized protein n=1 Tax=Canavalia gladiata TaxID=3824 RepID=A0AAN9Q6L3_CANGL